MLTLMLETSIIVSIKVNKNEVRLANTELIMKLAKENYGIITTAMVAAAGLPRGSLKYLVDKGILEKASRGVYTLPEVREDEFINLQSRFKRGIFSCETALFLTDLTVRKPNRYHITFPNGYNLTNAKAETIVCSQSKEPYYSMGVEEIKTPGGNLVRSYSAERTLCDILRPKNHTDVQIISEAFKQYARSKEKNIPLLLEYAKKLKVEKRIRSYLEVLL